MLMSVMYRKPDLQFLLDADVSLSFNGRAFPPLTSYKGCLVQVGNGIELDTVGRQFEPYRWRPCGVAWDVVP